MNKAKMAIETLKASSVTKLCDLWEEIDKKEVTSEVAMVRGWIMEALEYKNPQAFEQWIDSLEDSPRMFYKEVA